MNIWLRKALLGLLLTGVMTAPAWGQGRIATVDLRKVFDKYYKTQEADASLKADAADLEKQHKDMLDSFKKLNEQYQTLLADANNQALSSEERDKRKKSAEEKLKDLSDMKDTISTFERSAQTRVRESNLRIRNNLVEEIRNLLNAKAKAAGYNLVLDTSANSLNETPIVLFFTPENDMTTELLNQLNATAPPSTSKSDDKTSSTSGSDKKK